MGLKLKEIGPYIFFPLSGVFLLATIYIFFKRRQLLKKVSGNEPSFNRLIVEDLRPNNPLEGYVSSSRNHIVDRDDSSLSEI